MGPIDDTHTRLSSAFPPTAPVAHRPSSEFDRLAVEYVAIAGAMRYIVCWNLVEHGRHLWREALAEAFELPATKQRWAARDKDYTHGDAK